MTLDDFLDEWHSPAEVVEVQTSGSTGTPKRMLVEKRRMLASARMTCDFLGLHRGDTSLLCLPLDYIAGKMMVVRSVERDMHLVSVPPSSHPLRDIDSIIDRPIDFAAMVPMQVYESLRVPDEASRLRAIRHLIIGGGAIDEALERQLSSFPNAVWSTYGMTETLSHIALRRVSGPGRTLWYRPFDGVRLSQDADGCLIVHAPAVNPSELFTNDIVEMRHDNTTGGKLFRVLGRRDNIIDSGGIKIQAEEVERLLRPHLSCPYMITKVSDERLGESVVLMLESEPVSLSSLCQAVLPKHWKPRHILFVPSLPLTPTGKPARAEAQHMAARMLSGSL